VAGELFVGGDGLAIGYLGDEQLTAERFVAHPFARAAERLYRTGDIVRYRPDGALEFIGRRDNQIKVRGFRIELGEVEAALKSHPGVAEAVVVVRSPTGAEKGLAAYYQARAGQVVTPQELRRHLQDRLPSYMVPGNIDVVESFVLGPTGKVDRNALPATGGVAESSGGTLRPLTPLENQLIAIWEQVLNVRLIKVTDNFFDLGGTSLMAVQLFSQLKQVFGKDLPLATLFQAPTVEQLAHVMETEGWQPPWKSLVAIQPGGTKTPIFMVPGVGGNVLGFAHLANLLGSDQPFYGCQSRGLDGREPPFRRIEDMAAAYLKEIREIQPTGPYRIAGSCMGGVVAYEMAQQLKQSGEEVSALVMIETWLPVSLRRRYYRAFTFFKPALFIAQGIWRHMSSIARRGPRAWWSGVRGMVGIGLDMLRKRDVYRGDNQIQYQDVVSAANFRAMASYVPRKYPGYLHFFLASERPVNRRFDTRMAWARLAEKGYSLDTVNVATSGEFYQHPHVDKLAERMRTVLDESPPGEGSS
jgi:thioesterase domain-containing protein/acyl carrier protein